MVAQCLALFGVFGLVLFIKESFRYKRVWIWVDFGVTVDRPFESQPMSWPRNIREMANHIELIMVVPLGMR